MKVEFRIADTFTDSLARLTGEEQKAVKTTAFDLQLNPASPGVLLDLERPEQRSIAGNIYLGTVDNVLPGMEAAFVEIGLEKNGFLYVDEIVGPELEGRKGARKIQDLIQKGQTILVRQRFRQDRRVRVAARPLHEEQGAGHHPQGFLDAPHDRLNDLLARPGRREIARDVQQRAPRA